MAGEANHAMVFGAAGLLGWSVVDQLLSGYPGAGVFSKVTAVVNRPVSEADLSLPRASPERPELQIVSGVNLLGVDSGRDLALQLKDRVPGVEEVTHVFYFVFYACNQDHIQECNINCDMMQRVVDAMNIASPSLRSFVYSGGTRGYGIYAPGGKLRAPLDEALADQLPEDYARTCAYPSFRRILTKASQSRGWSWTEVCPDAVVGFSPKGSGFSLALHWAQYLSLYAFNHGIRPDSSPSGERVEVPFPGCEEAFDSKSTPVSGKLLGRISIHAALNPETCRGRVLNVADNEQPITFRDLWPAIASWFGLVGTGPSGNHALKPGEYVDKYKHIFEENGRPKALACGVGAGRAQLDSVGWWLKFDRHLSLARLRASGFAEQRDPIEGWLDAFEKFRATGIIL